MSIEELNREKFKLSTLPNQTAQDWIDLAEKYKEAGGRGNTAYCLWMAKKLGAVIEERVVEQIDPPEPEYNWQEFTDI